jgi:RimJ/RimL family protein N-acetyltransferase
MQIATARLLLRAPMQCDLDGWAALMADPESATHLGGVQPRPVAWRSLATMAGSWSLKGFGMFSVLERSSGEWVGRIGPWYPEGWPGTEVGWGLLRRYCGRGYATEAAIAAIDWVFDTLEWSEVIHVIGPANQASQAVARRLGSARRGATAMPAPFETVAVEEWGQTRVEWRAQRARLPLP